MSPSPLVCGWSIRPLPRAAAEEARSAQKAAEDTVRAAKTREAAAITAGEKATLRAVNARHAVWKLVDEDRRKRGLDAVGEDRWGDNGALGGHGDLMDTHLGCTAAATELCRRVNDIQERRKRIVSRLIDRWSFLVVGVGVG